MPGRSRIVSSASQRLTIASKPACLGRPNPTRRHRSSEPDNSRRHCLRILREAGDRRAEVRSRGSSQNSSDPRVALERRLHDAALNAAAAAVNQTHLAQARPPPRRRRTPTTTDGCRAARRRADRARASIGISNGCSDMARSARSCRVRALSPSAPAAASARLYSAVTIVLMPPRTEKSPTTVMRRGCERRDEVVEDLVGDAARRRCRCCGTRSGST